MYIYFLRSDWISNVLRYPMLFPDEYARSEISKLLTRLGLRISENGLGWKFGPMGFQEQTIKQEVIGIPMPGGVADGLDALLSTVQMPGGVPVATVAVGKAGARNAALLAARILALNDEGLRKRLRAYRDEMAAAVEAKNAKRG